MFNLCRYVMKYTLCNVRIIKSIRAKGFISSSYHYHLRKFSSYVAPIRTVGKKYNFNIKNTTIELQKKLKKVNRKLEDGFSISLYSIDGILAHPCFKSSQISKADSVILINACYSMYEVPSVKRIEYVWRIWEKMKKSGIIDLDCYHLLLSVFRDCSTYVETKHLLNSLLKDGFSPTVETYTLLLECTCKNQDFDGIEFLLFAMKKDGHEISDRCFNAILFATVKSRGLDSAEDYLSNASKSLNSGICTSLLRGIAEQPLINLDCFNRFLREAREKGIEFSIQDRILIVESLILRTDLIAYIPLVLGPTGDWLSHPTTLCNLIARCLCMNNYPAVFEILKYMGDMVNHLTPGSEELPPCTYIELIITSMVRTGMPLNDILQICFERDSTLRLKRAAYTSLRCKLFEYSVAFFEAMKTVDLLLRPHYFWPMFLSCPSVEEIYKVITTMKRLNVELDYDTLRQYVLKHVNCTRPSVVLEKLEAVGIPPRNFVTPLLVEYFIKKQISFAMELYREHKSDIDHEKLYFTLAISLTRNQDFDGVSRIFSNDNQHLLGVFHNLIVLFKQDAKPHLIEQFLNTFRNNKISIFRVDLEELRLYLKIHNLSEKIWLNDLLNEVNSDLYRSRPHLRDMNIDELEDYSVHLRRNNYSLRQAFRRLLIMHAERGNIDRVMELKQELEENNMHFSVGMKAALLKCFCLKDNFKLAYDLFVEMKSTGLHEKLTGAIFLKLADTAAKNYYIEAMYEILKSRTYFHEDDLSRDCLRLMETVTQYHGIEAANQLLEYLIKNNYCGLKIVLLRPIMQHYLIRNEVENATLACLKYANRYRLMPMKQAIICKLAALAVKEQVHKSEPKFQLLLDKILRTSGYLYGSSHTNLVYILCLAKMGLLESLKLYLKESYTGIEEKLLWNECNKLSDQDNVTTLMNLETVFKNTQLNIEPIYINLLKIYCRNNDLKSARELLKSLEESKRLPSIEFLSMYSELLNGEDIS